MTEPNVTVSVTPSEAEALERVLAILNEPQYTNNGQYTATAETWDLPGAGIRVAEVTWSDGRGGGSFMQSDLPHGLAVCAQVERVVITMAHWGDEKEIDNEIAQLRWLIRDEKP